MSNDYGASFSMSGITNDRENRMAIHIKRISVDPEHIRRTISDITYLKDTIADVGLLQPILVRQTDRGYTVIDGARRLKALKELDIQELIIGRDVIVESSEREADEKFRQLIANVQREDINDIELGHAFVTLKEQYGYDYKDIALIIGKSQHYVTVKVGLAKRLLPELQALVINDLENVKCISNTFSNGSEDNYDPYHMNINIIEDIARLPADLQMAAYEAIRSKKMDQNEALRYLGSIKNVANNIVECSHNSATPMNNNFDICLKKIDRDLEKLLITVKAADVDANLAASVIEKLIERLNALQAELKMAPHVEKASVRSE